jgi:hypothetical protein
VEKYEQLKAKMIEKNIIFNLPCKLEEIERFEQQYFIKLPCEYRDFLHKIANGGNMIDGFPLLSLSEIKVSRETVNKEFPLSDYWIWEDDFDEIKLKKIEYGNLKLIDIGCGQSWNIILNGKCAGEMWFFSDVGVQPACPRRGFLSWFEYWLDEGDDYFTDFDYTK